MSIDAETLARWAEWGIQFAKTHWLWLVSIVVFWITLNQIRMMRRGLSSKSWPTAPGIIEKSRVSSHCDEDGTMYSACIAYHYTVEGKRYRGSTIQFGREGLSTSSFEGESRIIADYPEGRYVDVHYDPSKPKVSTLKTGLNGCGWIALLLCTLASGGVLFFCVKGLPLQVTVPL